MPRLRIGFNTDQHLPFAQLLERWQLLEELGCDHVWVADHLLPWWTDEYHLNEQQVPWDDGSGRDDSDYLEGWTLVSALLARTSSIRGGILVSNNLFRHPALVAKMAATVDQISGGRFSLGLGAGWFEPEHLTYGFGYPGPGERVERFDEALHVIVSLLREERSTFAGRHYELHNAPFAPRPAAGNVPLVVGATGPRMLRLAARYADVWSCEGDPATIAARGARLNAACAALERDPAEIRWSFYGYPATIGGDPLVSAAEFTRLIEPYRAVGVDEVIFELPDAFDERVLREVVEAALEWGAQT